MDVFPKLSFLVNRVVLVSIKVNLCTGHSPEHSSLQFTTFHCPTTNPLVYLQHPPTQFQQLLQSPITSPVYYFSVHCMYPVKCICLVSTNLDGGWEKQSIAVLALQGPSVTSCCCHSLSIHSRVQQRAYAFSFLKPLTFLRRAETFLLHQTKLAQPEGNANGSSPPTAASASIHSASLVELEEGETLPLTHAARALSPRQGQCSSYLLPFSSVPSPRNGYSMDMRQIFLKLISPYLWSHPFLLLFVTEFLKEQALLYQIPYLTFFYLNHYIQPLTLLIPLNYMS